MKKERTYFRVICLLILCVYACAITGCTNPSADDEIPLENSTGESEEKVLEKPNVTTSSDYMEAEEEISIDSVQTEPKIVEVDWSEYFRLGGKIKYKQ